MNATATQPILLTEARSPFHFNSSAYLLRIGRQSAQTLGELLDALRACPDDSIFQHTFRTLQEHHFIREGFSNDFAHWAYTDCNEAGLAERLASLDVRAFTSVSELRDQIVTIVDEYLKQNPAARDRLAIKPFYFCAADTVVVPTSFVAHNLNEFVNGMRHVSVHSIHHHFIEARLRLKLQTNDFSVWLDEDMGLPKAAAMLDRIDIYTSTLEGVRKKIIRLLETGRSSGDGH